MKKGMPWFRFYADVLGNPKIRGMSAELFQSWVFILCVACRYGGRLPSDDYLAFYLQKPLDEVKQVMADLEKRKLIVDARSDDVKRAGNADETQTKRWPHDWQDHQFTSDTSTERVRKHRENKKKKELAATEEKHSEGGVTFQKRPQIPDYREDITNYPSTSTPMGGSENEFSIGRVGLVRKVSVEARREAARRLNVATVDPLVAKYEAWPKSRTAIDPDRFFLGSLDKFWNGASASVKAACEPLPVEPLIKPIEPVEYSAALKSAARKIGVRNGSY